MSKEDLIRKLTSRKLWVALVAFVTSLLICFNVAEDVVTQVASVIMGIGSLIAYMFSEGWVDAKRAGNQTPVEVEDKVDDQQSEAV